MMSDCAAIVIAPISVLPGGPGWALAQLGDLGRDLRQELVVDGRLDVDALDRDARLAGVLQPGEDRGVRGALEVGVGAHDHRVLAAELEAAPASGVCAARSITRLPVAVEPVNITTSTASISAAPVAPSPVTTL